MTSIEIGLQAIKQRAIKLTSAGTAKGIDKNRIKYCLNIY